MVRRHSTGIQFPLHRNKGGYPDPFAFCSNVGHVLAKEICFILRTSCLQNIKTSFARKANYQDFSFFALSQDFGPIKNLLLSRSPLPKHNLHYYKRQRGQGIPPCVKEDIFKQSVLIEINIWIVGGDIYWWFSKMMFSTLCQMRNHLSMTSFVEKVASR